MWIIYLSQLTFLPDQFLREKGGGAGNATVIMDYHSNFLFGTNSITKDHSYFLIGLPDRGGHRGNCPPKSFLFLNKATITNLT